MNDEIQSYVFLELIKFIIIVSITLYISDALNSIVFVIFRKFRYFITLNYLSLTAQTHDISTKLVHNY